MLAWRGLKTSKEAPEFIPGSMSLKGGSIILKCFKNQKGSAFIEWLFILPMIIMIVSFSIEIGFIMYDFATINYAASSMAVEAARKGKFDSDVCSRGARYVQEYTSSKNIKDMGVRYAPNAVRWPEDCMDNEGAACIWAPWFGFEFQRGDVITVGVCCPVQFKIFYMEQLGHWIIKDNQLYLKAKASALSEPFI